VGRAPAPRVLGRRADLQQVPRGELFLDAKKIKIDNLENEIRGALQARKSETLLLRGDKSVLLGKAVDVMSLAKRAGARQLGIITTPTQAAPAVPKP